MLKHIECVQCHQPASMKVNAMLLCETCAAAWAKDDALKGKVNTILLRDITQELADRDEEVKRLRAEIQDLKAETIELRVLRLERAAFAARTGEPLPALHAHALLVFYDEAFDEGKASAEETITSLREVIDSMRRKRVQDEKG